MKIDQEHYEDMTMLIPNDSLVGDDAVQFGEVLAGVMAENPEDLVIDVSKVTQIDSKGLEVLVDATEQLIRSGRALKLAGADETLREILELTELASLFEYSDSVEYTPEAI
ncbi:MAG: STAS domain-containing protein [Phycisphaerae bacterium]|nr:STAS domain-containing protein [Planctomycetota bacterium]MBL7219111.1 STAS domain-containing protein [Phycisphaerae bacterium]